MNQNSKPFEIETDETTGQVRAARLYGRNLLDAEKPCESELWVNGLPLALRPHVDPNQPDKPHLKGERFTDHFSGWSLVLSRVMGERAGLKHPCFGIQSLVRRELCDQTCPTPGPGGPVVEAPLWVDTFSLLNWNWNFWGEDTRMIFPSSHSSGPDDEWGHVGYEHDTTEECKRWMQNVWRRIYPGCLVIHGGLFYDAKSENWLAITCRRPQVGYILNIEEAGRGVSYDFTLHAQFGLGETLQLPEVKIYYGPDRESMMCWLGDYTSLYYQEPPEWVHKTMWGHGLSWDNQPTWTQQADFWEEKIESGECSGINYSLITNRPISSGTTPTSYEPDPNHGSKEEFKAMCRRLSDKDVPILIWMSHAGLLYRGGPEIDDDWFIRGVDGRVCGSWGGIDQGGLTHINPGHPGYIEYTKKWIHFYIKECGCKGIFFDCLSWAFPPDYAPRSFMRYPGDTNLMALRFMQEVYDCIKECDADAIMMGEGTSLDGPINIFSLNTNPKRAIDGLGPRDFFLQLNNYSPKRFVIDQGGLLFPASGKSQIVDALEWLEHNRYLTKLLKERGGRAAFVHLPNDLSIIDDLLFVAYGGAHSGAQEYSDVRLPAPWDKISVLREEIRGTKYSLENDTWKNLPPGIYRMENS